jgi:signal transduction histidine kinase
MLWVQDTYGFSNDIASILEIDQLLHILLTKIVEAMHIRRGYIMICDSEKNMYEVKVSSGMDGVQIDTVAGSDPLARWFEKSRNILVLDDDKSPAFDELREQGICLVVPLVNKNRQIGIMGLGEKLSEDMYTDEDRELLMTIANQAAISIENAMLSAKIRAIEKNIYHSDKLSALGAFAASVAHEIKNPLASVKTFCQLVARKFEDPKFVEKFNGIVPREIERMESVLGHLLDFGKFSNPALAPVNVAQVINGLLELIHYEAFRNNVRITKKFSPDIPCITASEEQLKQVFMNLTLNALQAMPRGGELIISTVLDRPAGKLLIIFEDTGCGIAPEAIGNLFKPFFTTKAAGTGLGLSITKRIIKEHNGTIEVTSQLQKGTCFTVTLPVQLPLQ